MLNRTKQHILDIGSFQIFISIEKILMDVFIVEFVITVCYHSGGSMKLNACILHLVYMVYL